ncbi:hypothetical protein DIS24_g12104 [Lasiodiplodia hormozganensis]|uniref:Uncharacterized protein n=1 Tax=Lasiodiplodia hormozganensis TaxID=869390 RepID=A0AA39U289_9PEZI|nr:hypothetical protein DIS24_g12104 [Lasiodiplodia hormozganensis]
MHLEHINHVLAADLDWVVASDVFVKWHDEDGIPQCLGRLPPHAGNAGLSLMLGRSKHDADDQLLLFHLSIRLHASSKESPQDFFLPIPTDFLDTGGPLSLSDEHAENIIPTAWQVERSVSTELRRVMHVKTRLRYPGFVLMPAIKRSKQVLGTPRRLLLLLRSLSRATAFDAFLPDCERPRAALDALAIGVRQGLAKTSPLQFRLMFDGRSGKRDNWEAFGMAQDGLENGSGGNAAEDPPCYSEAGASAIGSEGDDKARADAEYVEVEPEPTQPFNSLEPTQADTPSDYIQFWRSACQSSRHQSSESTGSPDAVSDSVLRPSPPFEAAPGTELRDRKRPRSSGSDGATSRFPSDKRAAFTTPPYHPSSAAEPLSSRELSVPHSHATDADGAVSLSHDMTTWLYHAWDLDRNIHVAMQESLLALGYHAREGSVAEFDVVKGWCTSELVFRPEGVLGSVKPIGARRDVAEMVTWANSLLRGAEQVLFVELKTVADAARDGNVDEYKMRRSWWIARVFFSVGTEEHAVNFTRSHHRLSQGSLPPEHITNEL